MLGAPMNPTARPALVPRASLAALLLVALALRPQLSAIGPLADRIIADLDTTHAFVGLLTTIPVLCMGVFAFIGPALANLFGVRAGITLSVGTLLLFALLRAVVPGAVPLLFLTFAMGVGTGTVGPILPMFVRGRLSGHVVAGTAAYAAGTIIGAAVGGGVVVPLARVTGGWREALIVLTVVSALTLVGWLWIARRMPGSPGRDADRDPTAAATRRLELPRLPWRRPVAWAIGLLFGLQSWLYYGTTAWIANVYVERAWDPAAAAGLLTLMSVASLGAIVLVPALSARGASRRTLLAASAGIGALGLVGVTVPAEPAILWTALIGLGLGMTFTLVLTLPVDISDSQREVGAAATLMLLVGYLIASAAPFVLGAVRDATGNFEASLWLLVGIATLMVPFAWSLAPARLRPAARIAVV
jgi:CP family cyanate transporter-like MFS transporter